MIAYDEESISFAEHDECFYCYQKLDFPWIEWHGHESGKDGFSVIALHPRCAVDLSIRILRDVHEVECKTNTSLSLSPSPQAVP